MHAYDFFSSASVIRKMNKNDLLLCFSLVCHVVFLFVVTVQALVLIDCENKDAITQFMQFFKLRLTYLWRFNLFLNKSRVIVFACHTKMSNPTRTIEFYCKVLNITSSLDVQLTKCSKCPKNIFNWFFGEYQGDDFSEQQWMRIKCSHIIHIIRWITISQHVTCYYRTTTSNLRTTSTSASILTRLIVGKQQYSRCRQSKIWHSKHSSVVAASFYPKATRLLTCLSCSLSM